MNWDRTSWGEEYLVEWVVHFMADQRVEKVTAGREQGKIQPPK